MALMDDTHDIPEAVRDLAAVLWQVYPEGAQTALLEPSETFPYGTLLGPFRLDPFDLHRTSGESIDVLAGEGDGRYDPLRAALLERAHRAALLPTEVLDRMFEVIEADWCGPWDSPWQLLGLVGTDLPGFGSPDPSGLSSVGIIPLTECGLGHTGNSLTGLIAPPPVFGLWLVDEGFERDDAGRRIGESRLHIVVLADGRRWLRRAHRKDSPYQPFPDSTIGGIPFDPEMHVRTTTGVVAFEFVSGLVPEAVARVLQVAAVPETDPYEGLLRLTVSIASAVANAGGDITDIARVDPVVLAHIGSVVTSPRDSTGKFGDLGIDAMAAYIDRFLTDVDTLVHNGDGDWLAVEHLSGIDHSSARSAAAGFQRASSRLDDTTAAWFGTELLAERAAWESGSMADALTALRNCNTAQAARLARVISNRAAVWGVELDNATASAIAQALAVPVGRNNPCPCGSGRKAKHCCHGS